MTSQIPIPSDGPVPRRSDFKLLYNFCIILPSITLLQDPFVRPVTTSSSTESWGVLS